MSTLPCFHKESPGWELGPLCLEPKAIYPLCLFWGKTPALISLLKRGAEGHHPSNTRPNGAGWTHWEKLAKAILTTATDGLIGT